MPTDTGEPGGKRTGEQVTHYIKPGDKFDQACRGLLDKGFWIPWQAITNDSDQARITKKKKAASKTKYACTRCELNAWAKPGARLVCFKCQLEMRAVD